MNVIAKDFGFIEMKLKDNFYGIGGSRRFQNLGYRVPAVVDLIRKAPARKVAEPVAVEEPDPAEPDRRTYRMNVGYFKRKAIAYSLLRKSSLFMAFYTISFPVGMDDDLCYKVFNSTLTFCRKKLGLKSYLWCMERQANGTVHYHMLTNDYMYIRDVNVYVASSINYYVERGEASWGRSSFLTYNGVDVKAVTKRGTHRNPLTRRQIVAKVVGYLAKYMSKELRCESHRVWHCSRLVSALYISVAIDEADMRSLMPEEFDESNRPKCIVSEYYNIIIFNIVDSQFWRETVCAANDAVYAYFEIHNLW